MEENTKSHYFIGNIFNDPNQITLLRKIKSKLIKKYKLKDYHSNNLFYTNMVYLGFFDNDTVTLLMEEIVNHLLTSVKNAFQPFECNYGKYKIYPDKTYNRISLTFDDKDNHIQNVIVPYLYDHAIFPIFERKKHVRSPKVDIIFYQKSEVLDKDEDKQMKARIRNIRVPEEKFMIDNISLIKGVPSSFKKRGPPSIHDPMVFSVVSEYKYNIGQ